MENRIQYRGNGEVTEFFYNFVIFAAGDMEVYLDDALQVSGYEVVGAGDKEGGKVVFEKAPASGVLVTLSRNQECRNFQKATQDFSVRTVFELFHILFECGNRKI